MVRQGKNVSAPSELLNFRFATSPPTQQSHNDERRRNQRQPTSRRTDQDRASARKKAQTSMFYLHSSATHAFVLTRRSKQGYSFSGSDATVSWESVRIVKTLVGSTYGPDDVEETCPICLDTYSCARITKCGHCFCLPCLLRHAHTSSVTNPYQLVKCPSCALPLHVEDTRPVIMESIQPPRLNSRMKFYKLHRTRECPAPFLPRNGAMKHSSPHCCPLPTDSDGAFSRFNYVDITSYQMQLSVHLLELEDKVKELHVNDTELLFVQMALDFVKREIRKALEEVDDEQLLMERFQLPQTGMYQPISRHLLTRVESFNSSSDDVDESFCNVSGNFRGSEGDTLGRPKRGYSMDSSNSQGRLDQQKSTRQLPHLQGSMYLEEGESQFYQAGDGQLCFLSKFNMQCLSAEFSVNPPEEQIGQSLTTLQRRKMEPLPDEVEGNIIEIQNVHLTHEVRKRIPFLSHLPLYTDVAFIEIDLNSILSDDTKSKFKGEFEKRRKRRKDKKNAEKREDWVAKQKEQQRIDNIKSRVQRIDPNDDFFIFAEAEPLTEMDFPSVTGDRSTQHSPAVNSRPISGISFSAIVNTPSATTVTQEAFPKLGSPSLTVSTPQQPPWGRGWHATREPAKSLDEQLSTSPGQRSNSDIIKGKKSKGKKIHLFSTGGQHGY